jgi:SNF2 family DNA or RNA helicase
MKFVREPYQDLMHDHLVNRERAALFCGIGLGKTASTLSAFRTLVDEGAAKACLIVAPMRVANLTWPNEIRKWDQFREFKVERLRDVGDKPSGKAQIYLTNYERLLKTEQRLGPGGSVCSESWPRLANLSFCDTIIFDELTRAKNPKSEQINALRPFLQNHRRWGLTGTPRPNSILELFAQIRLLDDGQRLGYSFAAFQSAFFTPEGWSEYKYLPKEGVEEKIYRKIHDLALTLKSSDYLDIPDTVVEDIEVLLPKAAHGIYRELERELMVLIEDKEIVAINAAVLVNKLLQVCSGAIYSTQNEQRTVVQVHDGKLTALQRLLVDTGEPALIACNFIHERDRIVASLPGAVDAHQFKGDIEDAWNSGKIRYLVADPRGLGHGLNLQQGGRDVVWFSPCWSRELYDQFNGRVARKGQDRVPRIFRLVSPGTIDDVVVESLRERGDAQSEMMTVLTNFRLQGLTFRL